jgi:hypothetical protein
MERGKCLVLAIQLIGAIALAAAAPGAAAAAPGPNPATVVLRGSISDPAQPPPVPEGDPVVLRGSPPPSPQQAAPYNACPSGYDYDPSYGCVVPGYSYSPDDYGYGYWPYYGFGDFRSHGSRRHFSGPFPHRPGQGLTARFGPRMTHGFGHSFTSAGGFSRR